MDEGLEQGKALCRKGKLDLSLTQVLGSVALSSEKRNSGGDNSCVEKHLEIMRKGGL